jgi:hypothetical protein
MGLTEIDDTLKIESSEIQKGPQPPGQILVVEVGEEGQIFAVVPPLLKRKIEPREDLIIGTDKDCLVIEGRIIGLDRSPSLLVNVKTVDLDFLPGRIGDLGPTVFKVPIITPIILAGADG